MSKGKPFETEIESITFTPTPTEIPTPTETPTPMETSTPMETPTPTEESVETPLVYSESGFPIVEVQGVEDFTNIGLFLIFFIGLLSGLVSSGIMWRRLRT